MRRAAAKFVIACTFVVTVAIMLAPPRASAGGGGLSIPIAIISPGNSTMGSGLAAAGVFTGAWEDVSAFGQITYALNGSPASAPGLVRFEFSFDCVTIDVTAGDLTVSGVGQVAPHTLVPVAKCFRVIYTNGATILTEFRLQTLYSTQRGKELTRFSTQQITDYDDVSFTRSIISAKKPDGGYMNVRASDRGNFLVAVAERPSQVMSRTHVDRSFSYVNSETAVFTPTSGKIFYLLAYGISALNASSSVDGRFSINDDQETKIPVVISQQAGSTPAPGLGTVSTLAEPIPFVTNVKVAMDAGTLRVSGFIVGYEE